MRPALGWWAYYAPEIVTQYFIFQRTMLGYDSMTFIEGSTIVTDKSAQSAWHLETRTSKNFAMRLKRRCRRRNCEKLDAWHADGLSVTKPA
jgi:hypothetical protein